MKAPVASFILMAPVTSIRLPRLVEEHPDLGEKAPILQAMLEIRVSDALGPPIGDLQAELSAMLMDTFSKVEQEWEMQADLPLGNVPAPPPVHRIKGYVFSEPSGNWTLHLRRDNFLLVRLQKYPGWAEFIDFAKHLWIPFVKTVQPSSTVHLSVRYINRLPAGFVSYHPCTPEIIGNQIDFFQRTTHRHPLDDRFWAYISHGTAPPQWPDSVMLDTTTHIHANLPSSSFEIWELFSDLRTYKNDIFFTHHKESHAG